MAEIGLGVDPLDGLIQPVPPDKGCHGAESLFFGHSHVRVHVLENDRAEEVSFGTILRLDGSAVQDHLGPFFEGLFGPLEDFFHASPGGVGTEFGLFVETVPEFHGGGSLLELAFHFVIDVAHDDHVVHPEAALAGHAEAGSQKPWNGGVNVCIGHDDHMILSIAVDGRSFPQFPAQFEKLVACAVRTDKPDALDTRVGENILVNGPSAVDYVDHALGKACFQRHPVDHFRRDRVLPARADDHGASGSESVGHEGRPRVHGDVARCDDQESSEGFPEKILVDSVGEVHHRLVLLGQAVNGGCSGFNVLQDPCHRTSGFTDGPAVVLGEDAAKVLEMLAKLAVHGEKHVGAVSQRHVPPGLKSLVGSLDRRDGLLLCGRREFGDHLVRRGIGVLFNVG